MKTIYLVRHAESEGNVGPIQHGPTTPLSPKGIKQTESIADRFKSIKIDKIFSSPYKRTKDTAEAIANVLNQEVEYSDIFVERKIPSLLIGQQKGNPDALKIREEFAKNFHNPEWRCYDAENFTDLKNRAIKALEFIENAGYENTLLVTHSMFLQILTAIVLMGKNLTSQEYWQFYVNLETDNTGITVFRQRKYKEEEPKWRLVTWNDSSHLG